MKSLEDIKAIIIPTCDDVENIERAKTAIEFSKKHNLPKRCVVAGFGPDMNIALENPGKDKLNYHEGLQNYLIHKTDWMICSDIRSLNSIENILEVFPKGIEGKYALVSYPLHLMRFKRIIKDAKKAGKISEDIEIVYIPTKQHPKWIVHEVLSNIKYHLKGKPKYFRKK
ncbi:MAG: ElyC/SanA/YdcF family protein [Nanoarchaeota archaeon]